jgi:hypothetical protein
VWSDAAKRLSGFREAVLTALDANGYPVSVRVDTRAYDPVTGELPAIMPATLKVVEGPANLLCHYHDAKLWRLDSTQIKGRLQRRGERWVFVSKAFAPRSRVQMVSFLRNTQISAQKYLDTRGLLRPAVNWTAVKEVQRRAAQQRTS